jgi:autotransporter-associated beta strand protein
MLYLRRCAHSAVVLGVVLGASAQAYLPKPDLTAAGAIAALKADALLDAPQSSPPYGESYNLGPTGLRGWIYIDRNNVGGEGLITAQSRQILVTVASAPGSAVLAVDDVILGAMAASSGTVPLFAGDCRKAFGVAIGNAEKTGAGTLRVKRWRAGTTTDVNIPITIMGDYADTAPYACPKSALILANAITKLNQEALSGGWTGACSGLALLAAVKPGDANYSTVQAKLQNLAHAMAPEDLGLTGCDTWGWGYVNIFLSEYYLRTVADGSPDANVLHGIHEYTVGLAKGQSKYGTFGHGGAEAHADGSLHGSISWYGPVNSAGLVANIAIVIGKKALVTGGMPLDAEIDPAIERGSKFFAYFVNKGGIPYGEHEPWSGGHASNGKDAMAAVLFGLQDNRPVEREYFTRMSVAGWVGREYGHTGQGFSYLWSALGAGIGGDGAAAAHLKQVRWHLDLERRTDGSFVYDGGEQYGGGNIKTYLGSESYSGLSPTACYVLSYALPLKRLYITGRDANPANTLDAAKVANEIAAATYERDCPAYSVATLMAALGEYDPVVRHDAANELAKRSLTTTEVNTLIARITNGTLSPDANVRQGACETLGIRKTTGALTALSQRLSDTDQWVRGKAANALKNFGAAASGQLTPMLTAFAANATDPNVIVWDDPIQIANGYLADTLFQALASSTNALTGSARTSLLYPALRAGLKQPDGMARMYLGDFIRNLLTLADVQAVAPSLVDAAAERSPADRMFSDVIRYAALNTLGKYKIEEGIPLCLMVKEQTWHGDDWDPFTLLQGTYRGAAKSALPTLYKWQAHLPQFDGDGSIPDDRYANIAAKTAATIAAIENDTAPPTLTCFKSLTTAANPPVVTLPTTSSVLTANLTDLDLGVPNFFWSKVRGAGAVSFSPGGVTANANCTATFNTPGTYVLRATAVDRSILDYNTWITYSLGYFDFETYNEVLGAVTKDLTVTVGTDPNRAPVPRNQSVTTPLDTAAAITLVATDPNGDAVSYGVVTPPAHGALTGTAPDLVYTPASGYTGLDEFTFKANDGKVDSAAATIAIDVGTPGNRRPVAVNQFVTTPEDAAKGLVLTGTDSDNDPLTFEIVTGPVHGTLIGSPPNLTYQPAANYPGGNSTGADRFTFTVRDASQTSPVATVSLCVTPVNDPPQALAQSVSVSVNTANPITLAGLDAEGYALLYALASNPAHGTLSGTAPNLTYLPAANYHSADSFTFKVTDSEGAVSAVAAVSITVINDPPVANPQYVEVLPNTSKAITLTGSDNCNDPLTYAVLTQPAHGVLSGAAPNVTYTPAAGYTGADSFTFKTRDGVNDSPAAVVTLSVMQWQSWTNIAAGAWSAGASWAGGIAPGAGGSSDAVLSFNTSGYSGGSSNDLAGTFQLNRLNLGSALPALTVSGNALSFNINSATLPQVNQNGANTITLSNNASLTAETTLGGSGAGALTLSGVISGAGRLTKTSGGYLTLSGTNTYSGGTTVSRGTLMLANRNGFGSGAVTLAGGIDFKTGFEGNSSGGALPNPIILSGGMVSCDVSFGGKDIWTNTVIAGPGGLLVTGDGRSQGLTLQGSNTFQGGVTLGVPGSGDGTNVQLFNINSLGTGTLRTELAGSDLGSGGLRIQADLSAGVANPIELVTGARLVVNTSPDGTARAVKFTGPVTGGGSLVKTGTGTMTLSGAATYAGATKVSAGILACSTAGSLGQGALAISSGAKVALNFTGTRQITSLSFAGSAQPNGIYSAASSPTYFTGTGTVTVAPATSTALVLTGGVTPSNPGEFLTFTATVTGSTPGGMVAFYAGTALLGSSALNGSAQASVTVSSLASGSHTITAAYAGDTNNGASTSAGLPIQVLVALTPPAPPTNLVAMLGGDSIGLTWAAPSGAIGYNVKRATVSGGPYVTLGTSGTTRYTDLIELNGATCYYVVSATNGAGEGANSGEVGVAPDTLPSATTVVSSLGAAAPYGAAVAFTASVTASATGAVTFTDGPMVLGSGTLSSGQATFTPSAAALAMGDHAITATYAGDNSFAPSSSVAFSYTVNAKPLLLGGVTAANKVYDKTQAADLTGGAMSGILDGEIVTVVPGSGSFASAEVGTWAVTATGYALGGAHAGNYVLAAQPGVPNASITPRPLQLVGTRAYDGTAIAAAGILSVSNNLDDGNLTLSGSARLAAREVGARAVSASTGLARVQTNTGNTGASAAATLSVVMDTVPLAGNTLVAVIATRGTTSGGNIVTSISQTGAAWVRAAEAHNTSMTTEIWYAPNLSGAAQAITINQGSFLSAAVVMEYSGVLSANPLDQTKGATGTSIAAVTGTTATTTQANELWIGGIGFAHRTRTLGSLLNSFTAVGNSTSIHATNANNARVYALERFANATGTAFSGGTLSSSTQWAGTIATFRMLAPTTMALVGAAAGNYTLTGLSGSVQITPKPLMPSGLTSSNRIYDGTAVADLTGIPVLLPTEPVGTGTSSDGKPYSGDSVTLAGTAIAAFSDKHVGGLKPVTVTGLSLAGAQAGNYTLTQPPDLTATIAPLPLTVAAVGATKTYDGTNTAAGTPTLTPSLVPGDTTSILSQAFQDGNAGEGNKIIVPNITIDDGNGGANYAVTRVNDATGTITQAPASVTLGGLSHLYDGTPKAATATTEPSGLTVTFTYDGSPAEPSSPGSYAVVATLNELNYTGAGSGTLVIDVGSITAWQLAHFTSDELAAGLAADNVDADGDGFTNLAEYALGTNPRTADPSPLTLALEANNNNFTLTFIARSAAGAGYAGLTRKYDLECSPDPTTPGTWLGVPGFTKLVGDDKPVLVTLPIAEPQQFYRLSVRLE